MGDKVNMDNTLTTGVPQTCTLTNIENTEDIDQVTSMINLNRRFNQFGIAHDHYMASSPSSGSRMEDVRGSLTDCPASVATSSDTTPLTEITEMDEPIVNKATVVNNTDMVLSSEINHSPEDNSSINNVSADRCIDDTMCCGHATIKRESVAPAAKTFHRITIVAPAAEPSSVSVAKSNDSKQKPKVIYDGIGSFGDFAMLQVARHREARRRRKKKSMKLKIEMSDEKLFSCDYCHKSFTQSGNMRRHRRKFHLKDLINCN